MENTPSVPAGKHYLRNNSRLVMLLTIFPFAALLILLGQTEFLPIEGDWALAAAANQYDGNDVILPQPGFRTQLFFPLIKFFYSVIPSPELAIRLPAVLGALLLFTGTISLAIHISGRKNAICTSWLLLSSYGFLYWGRMGCEAIFSAAAAVWALWIFYSINNNQNIDPKRLTLFFLLLAATLLCCGFTSVILILLLLLPRWSMMIYRRSFSWKSCAWGSLAVIVAVIITAAVYFLTILNQTYATGFTGSYQKALSTALQIFADLKQEFTTVSDKTLPASMLNLPRLLLPWTILLPAAAAGLYLHRRELPGEWKTLLTGIGIALAASCCLPQSQFQMALPLLAPSIIMLSAGTSNRFKSAKILNYSEIILRSILVLISAMLIAIPFTWPIWSELFYTSPPLLLMIIPVITGVWLLTIFIFGTGRNSPLELLVRRESPLAGTVIAGTLLAILIQCLILPELNAFRTARPFWSTSSSYLENSSQTLIVFYKYPADAAALAYLAPRQKSIRIDSQKEMRKTIENHDGTIAIFTRNNSAIHEELKLLAAECSRTFPQWPLTTEESAVAFTSGGARRAEDNGVLWLLGL